jgi:hypothetical protein
VLEWAETEQRLSLWVFERKLWFLMLALGRALVGLFLARQAARRSAALYQHEGQRYERAAADPPLDRALGLCGGFNV